MMLVLGLLTLLLLALIITIYLSSTPSRPKPKISNRSFNNFLRDKSIQAPQQDKSKACILGSVHDKASAKQAHDSATNKLLHEAYEYTPRPSSLPDGKGSQKLKAIVLYATEYGFSKEVARRTAEALADVCRPRIVNVAEFRLVDFKAEEIVLLVTSTTGDGVVPNDASELAAALEQGDIHVSTHPDNGVKIHFSVLALGDMGYPHFCKAGITFEALFQKLFKTEPFSKRVDVDQEDWGAIDSWIQDVKAKIDKALQYSIIQVQPDYIESAIQNRGMSSSTITKYTRDNPFMATIKVKQLITKTGKDDDKETFHIEFDISEAKDAGMDYTPGDALGVIPINHPDEVEDLLATMKIDGQALVRIPFTPNPVTVREALLTYFDLKHVKPDMISLMAEASSSAHDRAKAYDLLGGQDSASITSTKNTQLKAYLADKEVRDVLADFPSAKPAAEYVIGHLRPLMPRYYSISSSQAKDKNIVSITAAVVRYKLHGKERTGVATTYMADRVQVHDRIPIFIHPNNDFRLPKDDSKPILMVGPGTGIAPFRSFLHERHLTGAIGKNILFFGCRYQDRDFLYGDQLRAFEDQGDLELYTAFSRDQEEKIYVQDVIRQQAGLVWETLLKEGHLYICGDASHMAADVHNAFLDIIMQNSTNRSKEYAQEYLDNLEKEHRYQKDVWVS